MLITKQPLLTSIVHEQKTHFLNPLLGSTEKIQILDQHDGKYMTNSVQIETLNNTDLANLMSVCNLLRSLLDGDVCDRRTKPKSH